MGLLKTNIHFYSYLNAIYQSKVFWHELLSFEHIVLLSNENYFLV